MLDASRRIPPLAKLESRFLESILPVRAFVTLTTRRRMALHRLDNAFCVWIRSLQAHNGVTLGWIRSTEETPQRHIHAALIAASPLDCAHAAVLWRMMVSPRYAEAAVVEPYKDGLYGLGYVLKQLGSSNEEIQFSDNIAAFAQHGGKSLFPTNAAQRRQRRRIGTQLTQASRLGGMGAGEPA